MTVARHERKPRAVIPTVLSCCRGIVPIIGSTVREARELARQLDELAAERLSTDVLVIGGGPAGTWAAIKAAEAGGRSR